jgi:uncharacterized repeat protein (TIGR03803 family)
MKPSSIRTYKLQMATLMVSFVLGTLAQAQTFTVLYTFSGGADGAYPRAIIRDIHGDLFGTTGSGGSSNNGTVFKLSRTGKETVLYSFSGGTDGGNPSTGLIEDAKNNFYGTTIAGGASGNGTVFKLGSTGKETVLYSLKGGADGALPFAGVILDARGNLYGTTIGGGAYGGGTVFKVNKTGKETVLHSFGKGSDGMVPNAGVVRDASGNLYGTTEYGGAWGYGTVFRLSATGKEKVLYSFKGGTDAAGPYAGVIRDLTGDLYGTTYYGGVFGAGTVYKLSRTGKETVLHSFGEGSDGAKPFVGVMEDAKGNLYGTTVYGGATNYGTVFELSKSGKQETVLYSFPNATDGAFPYAGVLRDAEGNLYGSAADGGDVNACGGYGCGVLYKLTP